MTNATRRCAEPVFCTGTGHRPSRASGTTPYFSRHAGGYYLCNSLRGSRNANHRTELIVHGGVRQLEPSTFHWLGFVRTPPCANTYTTLLKVICPEEFEQAIREWTQTLEGIEIDDDSLRAPFNIHENRIDGKTLRGSFQKHERAVHLLSALDHQTGCVLSQVRVDAKRTKPRRPLICLKRLF